MEAVIIVPDSENEASLQCLTQFLELGKKLRLSCESVNGGLCMFVFSCFAAVENVACFA